MIVENDQIEDGIQFDDKQYLAPEIISSNLITLKNDIFSLGLVLYELMSVSCEKVKPDTYADFDFVKDPAPTFYSKELQKIVN
jgi:serine/threonine protein kinase